MSQDSGTTFEEVLHAVAAELVRVEQHGSSGLISTPLLYPSGTKVVVRVDQAEKSFFVTDMGFGFHEAELMGAGAIYGRYARTIGDAAGVRFDSQAFFVLEVTREQLVGAIAAIANCSQEAVGIAALKHAERKAIDAEEQLYDRLVGIFTPAHVKRHAEIIGSSSTAYHVAAMVTARRRPVVFEAVSNQHVSVYAANSKFHDLALLEKPPVNVAFVRSKKDMGTYHNLLAQTAHVIEQSSPNARIAKLAEAA